MTTPDRLRQLIGLIDLTSLNDARDDDIESLCVKAVTAHGPVAAVCSWPDFTEQMKKALASAKTPVAVVINFPSGQASLEDVLADCETALAAGADELDLVWPYEAWLKGNHQKATAMVAKVKECCKGRAKLKVILESGAFKDMDDLAEASKAALAVGADMLKTSTGKIAKGASLEAAEVMLKAIKADGGTAGFKASGGIRSVEEAESYLRLAEEILGKDWPGPQKFRIGASRLLDNLLSELP